MHPAFEAQSVVHNRFRNRGITAMYKCSPTRGGRQNLKISPYIPVANKKWCAFESTKQVEMKKESVAKYTANRITSNGACAGSAKHQRSPVNPSFYAASVHTVVLPKGPVHLRLQNLGYGTVLELAFNPMMASTPSCAADSDEERVPISHRFSLEVSPHGVLDQGHATLELSHGAAVVLLSQLESNTQTTV